MQYNSFRIKGRHHPIEVLNMDTRYISIAHKPIFHWQKSKTILSWDIQRLWDRLITYRMNRNFNFNRFRHFFLTQHYHYKHTHTHTVDFQKEKKVELVSVLIKSEIFLAFNATLVLYNKRSSSRTYMLSIR